MSTNSRTVLSSFPPMKSNALHITRDSIRIFVPLRPLYGVPVYSSVGGRCPHRPPPRQVRWCPGGQDHPPYDGTSGTAFSRSTGKHRAAHERLCFTSIKKTTTLSDDRFGVGVDLSFRAASRQVFSARMSLTTVFGMGTGGPFSQSTPTMQKSYKNPSLYFTSQATACE